MFKIAIRSLFLAAAALAMPHAIAEAPDAVHVALNVGSDDAAAPSGCELRQAGVVEFGTPTTFSQGHASAVVTLALTSAETAADYLVRVEFTCEGPTAASDAGSFGPSTDHFHTAGQRAVRDGESSLIFTSHAPDHISANTIGRITVSSEYQRD